MDPVAIAAVLVAVVVVSLAARTIAARRDGARDELESRIDAALERAFQPGVGTHLEAPVRLDRIATVDAPPGEPERVPIVRVPLGTTDRPGRDLVYEHVADVLAVVHPIVRDEPVRHYDVQFTFGPDGLLVSWECRRVSVPPELADRLLTTEPYRVPQLRRDVERGDDGDETRAPVAWGRCRDYADGGRR